MKAFYFNEEKQALVEITIKKIFYSVTDVTDSVVDHIEATENGKDVSIDGSTPIYSSSKSFEEKKKYVPFSGYYVVNQVFNSEDNCYYYNNGGQPSKFDMLQGGFFIVYDPSSDSWSTTNGLKFYKSLNDYYDNESYVEIKEDGTEVIHEARLARFTFTDEEVDEINRIVEQINILHSRGIHLIYDLDESNHCFVKGLTPVYFDDVDEDITEEEKSLWGRAYSKKRITKSFVNRFGYDDRMVEDSKA